MSTPRKPSVRGEEERNELVVRWLRLAYRVARLTESRSKVLQLLGTEVVNDIAVDALIRAAELWDESRGMSFSSYLWQWVSLSLKAKGRTALRGLARIPVADGHDPDLVPARDLAGEDRDREDAVAEVAALLPVLTLRQQEVVRLLYYDDLSSVEAGRRLGVTKTAVLDHRDRALKRFRRKLRVG